MPQRSSRFAILASGVASFAGSADLDAVAPSILPTSGAALRHLVVRSIAPSGYEVLFDGQAVAVDDSGRFAAEAMVDSAVHARGWMPLCLRGPSGDTVCVPVEPNGFDTLELAPLRLQVDSTVLPVTDPEVPDSVPGVDSLDPVPVQGGVLLQHSAAGSTVTVKGRRRPRQGGQERVAVQSILRRPALGEPDVMRAVQALPGVVQSSDFSTKIYVRGSASDQNLILWDGAVVYSPSHFMGLFSTFLADATGGVEFHKGGFDPRHGNRLSSVLRVDPRIGGSGFPDSLRWLEGKIDGWTRGDSADTTDRFRLHGISRITTASGSLALEGRKSGWSWSVAARRTWIDQALELARDLDWMTFDIDYVFHDVQGNVTRSWGGDSLRVSLYQGRDRLAMGPISFEWGNFVVPVTAHKGFGGDSWWRPSFSVSRFDQEIEIEGVRDIVNSFDSWKIGQEVGWSPQGPVSVRMGHDHEHQEFLYANEDLVRSDTRGDTASAWLHAGWMQGSWEHPAGWGVRGGARSSWYDGLGQAAFEPRATVWWRPSADWRLELHEGRYAQFLTSLHDINSEEMTDIWYAYQKPMEPSTQWTTAFSAERTRLPGGFAVRGEGYYKDISRLPQLVDGDPDKVANPTRPDGNKITRSVADFDGWAMGGELTLSRDEGAITATASYGWSKSVLKQTADPVAEGSAPIPPFAPAWDQRHTFKGDLAATWIGDAGKAFWTASRKGRFFRSSLSLQYRSGHPRTDPAGYWDVHEPMQGVDGGQSAHDGTVHPIGNTLVQAGGFNQSNEADYFRLDATPVDFGREGSWRLYWSVLNATDHENVFQTLWLTDGPVPYKETTYQFPRLAFFVGWEKEF